MNIAKNAYCIPHPQLYSFLFEKKREMFSTFREIIGLFNIDHISIACINERHQVIFLSYTPSIEYHLIESKLWRYDLSYQKNFYQTNQTKQWDSLYHPSKYHELKYIKEQRNELFLGFSTAVTKSNFHCIYSFATKSSKTYFNLYDPLFIEIGDYCMQQFSNFLLK